MNLNRYKQKKNYIEEKEKATKKIFTKPPENIRKAKALDLNLNLSKYKCNKILIKKFLIKKILIKKFLDKERTPEIITDKYFLIEEEYKKLGKTYSPFLLFTPEELYKNIEEKNKTENFDYYKRHILLENYDEEPETNEEILEKIKILKENSLEKNEGIVYGYTKWFDHNGKQLLKKCILNSYDSENKFFHISIFPENSNNEIKKKVTRFNFIFEKDDPQNITRRVQLADKWREKAKKYLAMNHFINSFETGKIPELITQGFIDKILMLVFLYKSTPKKQMTPIEYEVK